MAGNDAQTVAIVGSGYGPYLVAAFLASKLKTLAPRLTVVDVGDSADPPLLSTLGAMKSLNEDVGVSEQEFVSGTQAQLNLAVHYQGWGSGSDSDVMFCDAAYGFMLDGVRFHQLFHRYRSQHPDAKLDDFCLVAQLARQGNFAPRSNNPRSIFSTVDYGFNLTSAHYRSFLQGRCQKLGIAEVAAGKLEITCGPDGIEELNIPGYGAVRADLYIDCTAKALLTASLDNPFRAAPGILGGMECKQTIYEISGSVGASYSEVNIDGDSLVSRVSADGLLLERRYQYLAGPRRAEQPELAGLDLYGRRAKSWCRNSIALGSAYGRLPALLIDPVHLLQAQLSHLVDLWPRGRAAEAVKQSFDRSSAQSFERAEEIAELHILCHPRTSTKGLPDGVNPRVSLFRDCGQLLAREGDFFHSNHWAPFLYALGVVPTGVERIAWTADLPRVEQQLTKLRSLILRASTAAGPYSDWLVKAGVRNTHES